MVFLEKPAADSGILVTAGSREPRLAAELMIADTNTYGPRLSEIADPVRLLAATGEYVERFSIDREPDLNLARQPTLSLGSREIAEGCGFECGVDRNG